MMADTDASTRKMIELTSNNLELLLNLLESDGNFEEGIDKMIEEVFLFYITVDLPNFEHAPYFEHHVNKQF